MFPGKSGLLSGCLVSLITEFTKISTQLISDSASTKQPIKTVFVLSETYFTFNNINNNNNNKKAHEISYLFFKYSKQSKIRF